MTRRIPLALLAAAALVGCGGKGNSNGGTAPGADSSLASDGGCPPFTEPAAQCQPLASDYRPRTNASKDDPWPACVSDDNTYHLLGMTTPGSAARVVAWDAIGVRLWRNPAPSSMDFLAARNQYSAPNGIGSRVERRQDIHFAEIPGNNKLKCSEMGIPEKYPDRCAGPAKIVPLINDAFQKGLTDNQPLVQAARIEAGLLWFFYLSTLSEAWTCYFEALDDCDGVWSHFNGARPRAERSGLGLYLGDLSPETRDRAFDGILATRCWRDLDKTLPAKDMTRYQRSLDELDRAEIHGLALVLRERFDRLACTDGEAQRAALAFTAVLGPLLDRAARAIDPTKADLLKAAYTAATPDKVNLPKVHAALDTLFPCP